MTRLALIAAGLVLTGAVAAARPAEAAPPVGLSITVTDGLSQVRSGAVLTYTAEVRNTGPTRLPGRLVLTVPAYARFAAHVGGRAVAGGRAWAVTVRPGNSVRRAVRVRLGRIPSGQLRVTVLASLYRGASVAGSPLIRTADADRIAGVKDPAHTVPSPGRSSPPRAAGSRGSSSGAPLTWSLAGAGFVALLAGGLIWRRRRRSLGPVEDAAN